MDGNDSSVHHGYLFAITLYLLPKDSHQVIKSQPLVNAGSESLVRKGCALVKDKKIIIIIIINVRS